VSICFGTGGEWPYGIAVRLVWSPKPAVLLPEYFNASMVPTILITQNVTALIASRHCWPQRDTTGAMLYLNLVNYLVQRLGTGRCRYSTIGQSGTITAVVNALAKAGVELGERGCIIPRPKGKR
jgi:hypothetical protein